MKAFFLFFVLLIFHVGVNAQTCDTTGTAVCVEVFEDKSVKSIHYYKHGLRTGKWVEFDKNGRLVRKTKYRRGKRIWEFSYAGNRVIQSIDRKGRVKAVRDCGC